MNNNTPPTIHYVLEGDDELNDIVSYSGWNSPAIGTIITLAPSAPAGRYEVVRVEWEINIGHYHYNQQALPRHSHIVVWVKPCDVPDSPQAKLTTIAQLLDDCLWIDGSHHKQWLLEQIANVVGVEHDNEGIPP